MEAQKVDLYKPIIADRVGAPPLVLRIGVTRQVDHIQGGVPQSSMKAEPYVLLSALPDEIRQRVETAIQMQLAAV